jgi:hypothetical protein
MILLDFFSWLSSSKVIQLLGGFAAISGGLGALFFVRLKSFWKERSDKQIESLKGEIQRSNSTISSLTSAYISNLNKIQEKRIEAAEKLWSAGLKVKECIPNVVTLSYNILLDTEISNAKIEEIALLKNITLNAQEEKLPGLLSAITKELEPYKPFITDKADFLLSAYLGFAGRVSYNFIKQFKNGSVTSWKNDKPIEGLLKPVLTEKEIREIYNVRINSFGTALYLFETKILSEIRESLYGKNMTLDTIAYLKLLETSLLKND